MKKYRTKKQAVYEFLKQEILLGVLKPGEQIINSNIAKQLDVSENPVREALHQLEMEGLVTIKPSIGTTVSILSKKELEDIYELKIFLESMGIRKAIENITDEDIKNLKLIIDESILAIEENDFLSVSNLNKRFHMGIYKKSNNPYLIKVIEDLWTLIFRYALVIYSTQQVNDFFDDHNDILDAISEKDVDRAEYLMTEHQNRAMNKMIEILENSLVFSTE
ncbi:GntR family transcriptional regulator [Bacillus sp. JJ1521]|uniref:GntR family transcriptional regulator n=1 Tax=Bacillus sp. JJ1521 TaxID=3122957 RepID=UPI002FFF8ED8